MSEAPREIWARHDGFWTPNDIYHEGVKYILKSEYDKLKAEVEQLKYAHEQCAGFLWAHGWDWEKVMANYQPGSSEE